MGDNPSNRLLTEEKHKNKRKNIFWGKDFRI